MKKRLGFFKFSCCTGCQFHFFYEQRYLLETLLNFDVVFSKILSSSGTPDGPFDVALIEGTVTEVWQVDELKRIREQSTLLFAIGSCAVSGGIPAIKATDPEIEIEKRVYKKLSSIHSIKPYAIDAYVKVDGYIRGCPPGERDLYEALTSVLTDKKPDFLHYSVCVECKLKGNTCVLVSYNVPCMGPVTNAGCGALCPSMNRACYSCFGPVKQANGSALAKKFKLMGLSKDDIIRKFTEFGAVTGEFRKAVEMMYED
ncbi:MAG: oxidoreductase [Nitrospirae bacterium]|nr:oxidoreductase [Nitrospirota bacterium]